MRGVEGSGEQLRSRSEVGADLGHSVPAQLGPSADLRTGHRRSGSNSDASAGDRGVLVESLGTIEQGLELNVSEVIWGFVDDFRISAPATMFTIIRASAPRC